MKNKLLRLIGSHRSDEIPILTFAVFDTNELNPYREIREGGIVVQHGDEQFDFSLDVEELTELIGFLIEMRNSVQEFNNNSKPIKEGEDGKEIQSV